MIRPSSFVRTSILGAVLSTLLHGQDPGGEGGPDLQQAQDQQKAARIAEDAAAKQREIDSMKAAGETFVATEKGDQPMEAPVSADLAFFMAPVMSFQPRRIAPGAGGDAVLVLSMQRGTVLAVGSKFQIDYAETQGPVRLGPWALGEPAIGVEEGAFRGQPVYENYAHVTIPVSVPADTPYGKYPINIKVLADITDGRSGSVQRVAQTQARAELVVGPALLSSGLSATRPLAGSPGEPDVAGAEPVDDGGVPTPTSAGSETREPGPVGARRADGPHSAVDAGSSGPADQPELLADRGDPVMLWISIGVGGLALMVLVLALRRR